MQQKDGYPRYGVTPTANKLYSLVRKGSMGTPAEVLQAFWQELRGRTRVTIDHPDLPDDPKQVAAEAVRTIWQAANEAATGALATLRAEARHAASAAEAERDAARAETAAAREEVAATSAQLTEARQAHDVMQAELAAERQAHAATQARLEAGRAELEAAGRQLAELRTQFSTELERAREQVTIAQERAEASERRALRELDTERTARQKSDRTAEIARRTGGGARRGARCGGGAGRTPRPARDAGRGAAPGRTGRGRSGAGAPAAGRIEAGATRAGGGWWQAAAIRWILAEMADYGLTMEELAAAGCFDPPPPPPPPPPPLAPTPPPVVCYRNAAGQSWDGQGDMPDWLRRAVNAGQSKEFYRAG